MAYSNFPSFLPRSVVTVLGWWMVNVSKAKLSDLQRSGIKLGHDLNHLVDGYYFMYCIDVLSVYKYNSHSNVTTSISTGWVNSGFQQNYSTAKPPSQSNGLGFTVGFLKIHLEVVICLTKVSGSSVLWVKVDMYICIYIYIQYIICVYCI